MSSVAAPALQALLQKALPAPHAATMPNAAAAALYPPTSMGLSVPAPGPGGYAGGGAATVPAKLGAGSPADLLEGLF
jgi:hypothetical protein